MCNHLWRDDQEKRTSNLVDIVILGASINSQITIHQSIWKIEKLTFRTATISSPTRTPKMINRFLVVYDSLIWF